MPCDLETARRVGDALCVDWVVVPVESFRRAIDVELEHAAITGGDLLTTGRIALDHLREFPDYYTRLAALEKEADMFWADKARPSPTLAGCRASVRPRAAFLVSIVVLLIVLLFVCWIGLMRSYDPIRSEPSHWPNDHALRPLQGRASLREAAGAHRG